jgi:hypothetical protein
MLGAARLPGGAPAGAAGAGGAKLVQPEGIFAYHSSPSTFTKFDPSMIGTGEGAQMYGHGFYFAENPAVSGQGGQYWGQFLNRFSPEEQGAAKALQGTNFNRGEVLATLQNSINEISDHLKYFKSSDPLMYEADVGYHNKLLRTRQQQYDMVASGNPVGPRTYEVNINARPEQMLNWNAPLTQQPAAVQQIASDVLRNPGRGAGFVADPTPTAPISGGNLYNAIAARAVSRLSPWERGRSGTDPVTASAMLNEAGIPGIRYLDQGSRNAGDWHITPPSQTVSGKWMVKSNDYNSKGLHFDTEAAAQAALAEKNNQRTSNYVIFDPNKLDIRRMYAVPGAVGAGGVMGGLATQDNYQPQ